MPDLRRFYVALLGGRLLPPHLLNEMRTTVPVQPTLPGLDFSYGLGLGRFTLPCGGFAYGHGGTLEGFYTNNFVAVDRRGRPVRTVSVLTNANPTTQTAGIDILRLAFAVLCDRG